MYDSLPPHDKALPEVEDASLDLEKLELQYGEGSFESQDRRHKSTDEQLLARAVGHLRNGNKTSNATIHSKLDQAQTLANEESRLPPRKRPQPKYNLAARALGYESSVPGPLAAKPDSMTDECLTKHARSLWDFWMKASGGEQARRWDWAAYLESGPKWLSTPPGALRQVSRLRANTVKQDLSATRTACISMYSAV